MNRGIREGDPLSPFVFELMVGEFNKTVLRAVDILIYKGLEVMTRNMYISHWQFSENLWAPACF